MKIKLIYILIILFFSCSEDPLTYNLNQLGLEESNINWFYDIDDQKLLIQIDTDHISQDIISSLKIKLHPFHDNFFEIFDNGEDSDLIPNNNIYSILINNLPQDEDYTLYTEMELNSDNLVDEYQYYIQFNSPTIINNSVYPYLPAEHILDQNNITFLDLILAINDDDGRNDIEYVRYYIKKVNFFNGSLSEQGSCEYELVEENEYIWDPTWIMNYESTNASGNLLYRVQIPMNPIISESDCGGFGWVQFKFEVKDSKGFSDILEFDNITQICPGVCE